MGRGVQFRLGRVGGGGLGRSVGSRYQFRDCIRNWSDLNRAEQSESEQRQRNCDILVVLASQFVRDREFLQATQAPKDGRGLFRASKPGAKPP